jgi:ribosomal-protein-serine acetyltransferase
MLIARVDHSLELRLWEERHAEELSAVVEANRSHLREWLPWVDKSQDPLDSRRFIQTALEQFARNDGFHAGIFLDGRIVGAVGLHYINWTSHRTEIGYWLAESVQGRGIITRACRGVLGYLFDEVKLNRVEIQCALDNHRSRRVPERLGFRQEGILRAAGFLYDRYKDHVVYSMLAGEWKVQPRQQEELS